jgi:DNA-binding NtrC family response regulator
MTDKPEYTLLFALKRSSYGTELIETFQKKDFKVLVTGTGEETLSKYIDHPEVAVMLISIDLSGMDAFETVNKIRQFDVAVPVILLSDYVTINTIRLALETGCTEILQTPVSKGMLEGILQKYLNTNN